MFERAIKIDFMVTSAWSSDLNWEWANHDEKLSFIERSGPLDMRNDITVHIRDFDCLLLARVVYILSCRIHDLVNYIEAREREVIWRPRRNTSLHYFRDWAHKRRDMARSPSTTTERIYATNCTDRIWADASKRAHLCEQAGQRERTASRTEAPFQPITISIQWGTWRRLFTAARLLLL